MGDGLPSSSLRAGRHHVCLRALRSLFFNQGEREMQRKNKEKKQREKTNPRLRKLMFLPYFPESPKVSLDVCVTAQPRTEWQWDDPRSLHDRAY